MARAIGIDIGSKRVGVAISDETKTIAGPLKVLGSSTEDIICGLKDMMSGYDIDEIVVGLPLNMNGSKGPQAEKALRLAQSLRERLDIDVRTFDERLTTSQGEAIMIAADMSRNKRKQKIDKMAAQIMLQAYLDSK